MNHLAPAFITKQKEVLEGVIERLSGSRFRETVQSQDELATADFGDLSSAISAIDSAMALVSNSSLTVRECHIALKKIEKGVYGLCEATGDKISEERLEAIPWTRFTVKAQYELEKNGGFNKGRRSPTLFDDDAPEEDDSGEESQVDEK